MKRVFVLNLLVFAIILVSCSSDDSGDNPNDQNITGNYFPSTVDDTWTFDVASSSDDNPIFNFNETDLLRVATSTANSFSIEANNGAPAFGTMSAFLVNGTLTRGDSNLSYDGTLELPADVGTFLDSEITLNNVVLYDLNASNNTVLSSISGTIDNQELDLGQIVLPLNISYTFTSTKTGTSDSETVGGEIYENVTKTRLVLSIEVTTVIELIPGIPSAVSILNSQNVLSMDCEFAENVGLIEAKTTQGYMLSDDIVTYLDLAGIVIGVPNSLSVSNNQDLDSYFVTLN